MGLGLKITLGPLLLWQGRAVRARALKLPEAAGPREGREGQGAPALRLLVVGDSSAAGVGVEHQRQAFAMPLARALADRLGGAVDWQLLATTGHTAADALERFADPATAVRPADVLVTVVGVNDVVAQVSPARWLRTLEQLHRTGIERAGIRLTVHSGVPPMHRFTLLPQPLRAVLGLDARALDGALSRVLRFEPAGGPQRLHWPLPVMGPDLDDEGLRAQGWIAADGFHPGPKAYQAWAEGMAATIAAAIA